MHDPIAALAASGEEIRRTFCAGPCTLDLKPGCGEPHRRAFDKSPVMPGRRCFQLLTIGRIGLLPKYRAGIVSEKMRWGS